MQFIFPKLQFTEHRVSLLSKAEVSPLFHKGPDSKILGIESHMIFVTTTEVDSHRKQPETMYKQRECLCSSYYKSPDGRLDLDHEPLFAYSCI